MGGRSDGGRARISLERPSLSDDLRSVLSEPVASSEVTDGYVLLPEVARSSAQENPGVSAPIIYQYIIAPRGGAERPGHR